MYDTHNTRKVGERGILVTRFDQIESAKLTDVGRKRSHNQDNYAIKLAADEERFQQFGHLFLVADGMGGHAVGEKASEMAAAIIPHTYEKHAPEGPPDALRKAFLEANGSINSCGEQNVEFRGMGTTSTALLIRPDGAWLAHVGDSRAYRVRNGAIEQLTYDHSYVWEYARQVGKDPDEVKDFPHNIIHRCLGPRPSSELTVDIEGPHPVLPGDIFLLCSDGLSGPVDDPVLGVVASILPPGEACQFLVDLANLRGGPDNITVLVVRIPGNNPESQSIAAPNPIRPLWQRVPWPAQSLLGGSFLAGVAILVQSAWPAATALAGFVFLLAVGPILAGVVGMVLDHKRRKEPVTEEQHVARVYRSKPCRLDKSLLEKLARAARTLRQRAEEQQWDPDLATYDQHHEKAEQLVRAGDLAEAFREYCRAMRPLNIAAQKHAAKEEGFQPVWD